MLHNKLFRRRETKASSVNNEAEDEKNKIEAGKLTWNKKSYKFVSGFIEISFWKIFTQETPQVTRHH